MNLSLFDWTVIGLVMSVPLGWLIYAKMRGQSIKSTAESVRASLELNAELIAADPQAYARAEFKRATSVWRAVVECPQGWLSVMFLLMYFYRNYVLGVAVLGSPIFMIILNGIDFGAWYGMIALKDPEDDVEVLKYGKSSKKIKMFKQRAWFLSLFILVSYATSFVAGYVEGRYSQTKSVKKGEKNTTDYASLQRLKRQALVNLKSYNSLALKASSQAVRESSKGGCGRKCLSLKDNAKSYKAQSAEATKNYNGYVKQEDEYLKSNKAVSVGSFFNLMFFSFLTTLAGFLATRWFEDVKDQRDAVKLAAAAHNIRKNVSDGESVLHDALVEFGDNVGKMALKKREFQKLNSVETITVIQKEKRKETPSYLAIYQLFSEKKYIRSLSGKELSADLAHSAYVRQQKDNGGSVLTLTQFKGIYEDAVSSYIDDVLWENDSAQNWSVIIEA